MHARGLASAILDGGYGPLKDQRRLRAPLPRHTLPVSLAKDDDVSDWSDSEDDVYERDWKSFEPRKPSFHDIGRDPEPRDRPDRSRAVDRLRRQARHEGNR